MSGHQLVDPDHLHTISWLHTVHLAVLQHHSHRLGQESRRSHFGEFLDYHFLHSSEGTHAVLERQIVTVLILSAYEAGLIWFKDLLRVKAIRVLFDVVLLRLFAPMHALLELAANDLHLGDDTLYSYQLVRQLAGQTSRSHEVGAQIPHEADLVMLYFGLVPALGIPHHTPLQESLSKPVELAGIPYNLLCDLRVLRPKGI